MDRSGARFKVIEDLSVRLLADAFRCARVILGTLLKLKALNLLKGTGVQ